MSATKRTLDATAESLGIPVDELIAWLTGPDGPDGLYNPHSAPPAVVLTLPAERRAVILHAARTLDVSLSELTAWLFTREPQRVVVDANPADAEAWRASTLAHGVGHLVVVPSEGSTVELVSEDDFRAFVADLVAEWADGHAEAHVVLSTIHTASHGLPVRSPSQRKVEKIRERVAGAERGVARDVRAILDGRA